MMIVIDIFHYDTQDYSVDFVESYQVTDGVNCDTYTFRDDPSRDLAIITIVPGNHTPRQKVVGGDETIEGRLSGQGTLTIWRNNKPTIYDTDRPQQVMIGEEMQWCATSSENLVCYEICTPPYSDGRFIDLD